MAESLPTDIELELVTPDRPVVRGTVIGVSLPGKDGYLGILPGHAPLLSELKAGELSYGTIPALERQLAEAEAPCRGAVGAAGSCGGTSGCRTPSREPIQAAHQTAGGSNS